MAYKEPTYITTNNGGFTLAENVHRVTVDEVNGQTRVCLVGGHLDIFYFDDSLKALELINVVRAAKGMEPYVPPTIKLGALS